MAWPTDLYPASFRGVPFEVEGNDVEFGLRHEVHEFPGRDGAVVEDLGRLPQRLSIQAFVVGDDWLDRKRKLVEACTRRGSGGTLVLPWWGALAAFCTRCEVRESNLDGGIVRFSLQFVRVEGKPQIFDLPTPARDVEDRSEAVSAGAELETSAGLAAAGVPDYVREGTSDQLAELGGLMRKLDVFSGPAALAAEMAQRVASLVTQASVLATAPVSAAATVRLAVENVLYASANALSALQAYEAFFEFEAKSLGGTSAFSVARDTNSALIAAQVRQTALAGAARAAAAVSWTSYDDAVIARGRVLEALDVELETASPAAYPTLAQLRASLVSAVPAPTANLPRLRTLALPAPTSTLQLAYELYDDIERAGEISGRNRPEFPGRMAAGSVIQVLSR